MSNEITFVEEEYSDREIFSLLRPYIVEWFKSKYGTFTPPQRKTIPEIKKGNNVLISSPTGTGKTLAAFLGILDDLFRLAEKDELENKIYVVYVSPLRALNNDMRRNLIEPLSEIEKLCENQGYGRLKIRVAVRTSDTSPYEKQKMLKKPPHILITTPESFAIALVAPKFRKLLKDVRWVIVDEIHELCSSKRGVHLSLSIERLEHYVGKPLIRIGLSATIAPLIEVAKFLVGYDSSNKPRKCRIVDARFAKPLRIKVISPLRDIVYASAEEINEAIYSTLVKIINEHRTTLVFTNTRSATERVVYKLRKIFKSNGVLDADLIEAHHSSLSRNIRLAVEEKLKQGLLKSVVCVSPDSMVLTINGWKKIKEMQRHDGVYCLDLKDLKLKPSSFDRILARDYQGKGYLIETSLGYGIKCTPDHKFLVLKDNKLSWKTAEELNTGDHVAIARTVNIGLKGKHGGLTTLKTLSLGDIFFDEIVKKGIINLNEVCSLVNTSMGNYVVNGFVCKNCSTSLELGIDIGYIDVVVLLSSPKSVSRLLQRVGRSGHKLRNLSKGFLIVVDRDDLVECTVLAKVALERKIDNVSIPKNALDVLAQHIVGMALEKKWKIKEAYELVKRSYNYHNLSFNDFMSVLRYLSGAYEELKSMKVYAKIWVVEKEGVFGRRGRGKTRMIYYMNSGTIPDEAKITVITDKGKYLGTIDEQFLQILVPGDVFVLGGRTYKFVRSYGSLILVREVEGERPTVPSWFSEMLPLSYDSALLIGRFRRTIAKMIDEGVESSRIIDYIAETYNVERKDAESIYKYILEEYLFTEGNVPGDDLILVEVYDEAYRRNIIFHTLYGRRVNDALSRAYGYVLSKIVSENVKITVTDNGFVLTIPRRNTDLKKLLAEVSSKNIASLLKNALKNTELLRRRFRHCAERAFMILKRYMDTEKSVHRLQLSAQNLLKIVETYKDFPVLKETYREILEDFMDISNAINVLKNIEKGRIKVKVLSPRNVPSPFAHNMLLQGYSDIVLMEDRRTMLLKLHKRVMEYLKLRSNY